jgi:hypothetical protein
MIWRPDHIILEENQSGALNLCPARYKGERVAMETLMNSHFTDESLNWRMLCRAAAVEQNPDVLAQIVHRINLALKLRQRVLLSFAEARRDKSPKMASDRNHADVSYD